MKGKKPKTKNSIAEHSLLDLYTNHHTIHFNAILLRLQEISSHLLSRKLVSFPEF